MSWQYGEVIKQRIADSKIQKKKLCEGLCSESMLSRLANGQRVANKMLSDRLMQRLGISDDGNEDFPFSDEYDNWRLRQRIVCLINSEKIEEASKLLREYENNAKGHLEVQFCITMKIELLQMKNPKSDEIRKLIEAALKLTVPRFWQRDITDFILSVHELNLIIITTSLYAYEIMKDIEDCIACNNYALALVKVSELEKTISTNVPINEQYIDIQKIRILYADKKMNKREALCRLIQTLGKTVSFDIIEGQSEGYLTHVEIMCIYFLAKIDSYKRWSTYHDILFNICKYYINKNEIVENIDIYLPLMTLIASVLSSMGRYEEAVTISKENIEWSFFTYRGQYIARNMKILEHINTRHHIDTTC